MNKSQIEDTSSSMARRRVQRSETLNRKYVHRPNSVAAKTSDIKVNIISDVAKKQPEKPVLSAQERKEQAIKKALSSVATMENTEIKQPVMPTKKKRSKDNSRRLVMAFACAIVCIAALGAFINVNMPDLSVRVAAMQTGIEAAYPSYIPRDYSLSNIVSENGKITMEFTGPNDAKFTLTEERSSWDSAALLNNFVKPKWEDNYTITHEQGLTVYINNSNATWVNGGIIYNITSSANNLTKKQIRNIVTSL